MLQFTSGLTQLERIAVGALFLGRIHLMRADLYAVQRAVIRGAAMICALVDTAVNALVCMTFFHDHVLLFVDSVVAFPVGHILCIGILRLRFLCCIVLLHKIKEFLPTVVLNDGRRTNLSGKILMLFDGIYRQMVLEQQIRRQLCGIVHRLVKISALIDTQLYTNAVPIAAFLPAAVSRMVSHLVIR